MADLPHKERPIFIDAQRYQRRRNVAAALLAVTAIPAGVQINGPSLALTALSPTVTVTGAEYPQYAGRPVRIEAPTYQPRKPLASLYRAISSAPATGPAIAIPTIGLGMQAFAPLITQSTPIFGGQDLQSERDPEVWQPGRRSYLFAYQKPGSNTVIVNGGSLSLAALSPTVSLSGLIPISAGALSLAPLEPVISQAFLGVVNIQTTALQLTALSPDVSIAGPGVVDVIPPALILSALNPTISQVTDIGRVTISMKTEKITIRLNHA